MFYRQQKGVLTAPFKLSSSPTEMRSELGSNLIVTGNKRQSIMLSMFLLICLRQHNIGRTGSRQSTEDKQRF